MPHLAQTLFITDARCLGSQLDKAVEAAISTATARPGMGILVTRHDQNMFTVALSEEVPAGTTRELDLR